MKSVLKCAIIASFASITALSTTAQASCDLTGTWSRFVEDTSAANSGIKTTWMIYNGELLSVTELVDDYGTYVEYDVTYKMNYDVKTSLLTGAADKVIEWNYRNFEDPTSAQEVVTRKVSKKLNHKVEFAPDCSQATFFTPDDVVFALKRVR